MRLAFLAALALVGGCVNTQVTELGSHVSRPILSPSDVAIYRTSEQAPSPYDEVALIKVTGPPVLNDELMHKEMRGRAAKLGANGLILQGIVEPSEGRKTAAMWAPGFVQADRVGTAIAIFVRTKEPEPAK